MTTVVTARPATAKELAAWDDMVAASPQHRVFHRKAWIESIEAFSGSKPLYLVLERDGTAVGLCPGFVTRIALFRLFGSPMEGWQAGTMGPLCLSDGVSVQDLLEALVSYLEREHKTHHIELICRGLQNDGIERLGFVAEPVPTQVVQLFPGDEERAMRALPQKTRNQLRKALKLGLVARVA